MKNFALSLSIALLVLGVGRVGLPTASAKVHVEVEKTVKNDTSVAEFYSLRSVRLLDSPFTAAVKANREYLLALEPDRLLAPFRREAGLKERKPSYGNWENTGLDGHTAGHYLSALAAMIASGADTPDGLLHKRLDYMIDELDLCQKANSDGYIGGVPQSHALWKDVAAGHIDATGFSLNGKWVPWYNLHKTFAGLRDASLVGGNKKAHDLLIRFGDWADTVTAGLSDEQMQTMLRAEHGGMNEVIADIYAITGDAKYLRLAQRFCDKTVLDPLMAHKDTLTGKHANTQIPKVIGLERIAALTNDAKEDSGAAFFWERVTGARSIVFGGNSVSEHFNDPKNFQGMLESREGPETCNTYNMLHLTKQLFARHPRAAYADYYERALFNHLLASINPTHPGYVYFTPIRPGHYRVYSTPDQCFWCCVGTGMENPGKYGEFVYAHAKDGGIYVNLFVASELSAPEAGLKLRQETAFPDEPRTRLTLKLSHAKTFPLYLRHPGWVAADAFAVRVNGKPIAVKSAPSSYVEVRREWHDGDQVEIDLPMRTTVEQLPDGSDWYAVLHGPIVLASPDGTSGLEGLRAGAGRGDHVARGPLTALDRMPALVTTALDLPRHIVPDPDGKPLDFRLTDVSRPATAKGLPLIPFFRLHDSRYQMYWEVTSQTQYAERQAQLAAQERLREAREAATLDSVAIGEQQPEVDHAFLGQESDTGTFQGRRWRHGRSFQYTLNTRGEKTADLAVTYWGGDAGRVFDIFINGKLIATQELQNKKPGQFFEMLYPIPAEALTAKNSSVTVKFVGKGTLAGGVFDVRLLRQGEKL
jgi:DUF1680 family protein